MDKELKQKTATMLAIACVIAAHIGLPAVADNFRSSARTSVNGNRNFNGNRNVNANRNVNVNQNVNVNRNVDVNVHGGYSGGCCYNDYHPVATAAAVVATAAVIGSIVASIPPSCSTVMVNGLTYRQCGNTWYQPQISGSSTTYVVVNPPR